MCLRFSFLEIIIPCLVAIFAFIGGAQTEGGLKRSEWETGVSISPTNAPANAGAGLSTGQTVPQRASLAKPDARAPATDPEDIQQICKPSSVSLDPTSVQPLARVVALDAMTKASLTAISQTLKMNDDLAKLLGGKP